MELNWAEHFRSGPDHPGGPAPGPPWPTASAEEQTEQETLSPSRTDTWAEHPDEVSGEPEAEERGTYGERRRVSTRPVAWLRQVSFRGRVSALVAVAVALAVALAALSSYIAVSGQLERQANANLQSAVLQDIPPASRLLFPNGINSQSFDLTPLIRLQLETGYQVQVIANTPQGVQTDAVVPKSENGWVQERFFKLTSKARATFKSPPRTESAFQTQQGIDGNPYRVTTLSIEQGSLAVMLGYPLSSLDNTLGFLRLILILVAIGGVALGAALGWVVGKASMHPVEELTLAAERVAETQDLSQKIEDTSNDELGRLARSFNAMLAALSSSRQQQAQLISDAGHELRTPLTSLRTNIEVLMRTKDLPPADRDELLSDVDAQLQELATMVGDLVDLARDEERRELDPELIAFDQVVSHAVERAKRRAMSVHFDASLQPGYVRGQPGLLERAVVNVLDNAAKWSPSGSEVGVRLWTEAGNWHLVVTDQGPGIPPEDLPRIFDRFYRAASARSMPGSGLGLAIVKRAITAQGGTIDITCPATGGTRVEIVLPLEEQAAADNGCAGNAWSGNGSEPVDSISADH